jgi:hypothetical protein
MIKKFKAIYSGKLIIDDDDDYRFEKISSLLHRTNGLMEANNNSLIAQDKQLDSYLSRKI